MQNVPRLANLVFCSQCTLLDHDRCFRAVLGNLHRQNRFQILVKTTSIKYTHCPVNEHASQIKNRLKTCFQTNSENNLWGIAALCFHLLCIPRDVFYLQSLRFGRQTIPDYEGRVMKGRYTFQNDFCENDTTSKNRTSPHYQKSSVNQRWVSRQSFPDRTMFENEVWMKQGQTASSRLTGVNRL